MISINLPNGDTLMVTENSNFKTELRLYNGTKVKTIELNSTNTYRLGMALLNRVLVKGDSS